MVLLAPCRERRSRADRIVLVMGLLEWVEEMEEAVDGLLFWYIMMIVVVCLLLW